MTIRNIELITGRHRAIFGENENPENLEFLFIATWSPAPLRLSLFFVAFRATPAPIQEVFKI